MLGHQNNQASKGIAAIWLVDESLSGSERGEKYTEKKGPSFEKINSYYNSHDTVSLN